MTDEEREDLTGLQPDAPDAEDAGEALMAAALDAGFEAEDAEDLDPEEAFDSEAVSVGRAGLDDDDEDETEHDRAVASDLAFQSV